MPRRTLILALTLVLTVLPPLAAGAWEGGPRPQEEPPLGGEAVALVDGELRVVREGLAEAGPWLPLHGGTMLGDITMSQGTRLAFPAGLLDAPAGGALRFRGVPVQMRVAGVCAEGSAIRAVAADGSVTCEQDDGQRYREGFGIDIVGTDLLEVDVREVQRRVLGSCAAGSSVSAVLGDGSVACEADDDTTYTAGSGLRLAGTEFSADTSVVQQRVAGSCAAGSSVRVIRADGTVDCEADDDTTYGAGSGLRLSGTTFAVMDCAEGEVLKFDTAWACAADADTTYTAGSGVRLVGTQFSADTSVVQQRVAGSCAAGSSVRVIRADGTVDCEADDGVTYTGTSPIVVSGTTLSLSTTGCVAGDVWKRTSTAWSCDPDLDTNSGGTVTSVATGSGLTGGPITTSGSLSVATGGILGSHLADGAVTAAKTADEPGVRGGPRSGVVAVNATYAALASVSVTFPAAGFALVLSQAAWEQDSRSASAVDVRLLEASTVLQTWTWDAGDDDGLHDLMQSHATVLTVSAGAHTYRLEARQTAGEASANAGQLLVAFFATQY